MSRDLPPRPDFDHLRKQAKAPLRTRRQLRADATLADAQHALAREYGFASWPKLKAHIEGWRRPCPLLLTLRGGAVRSDAHRARARPARRDSRRPRAHPDADRALDARGASRVGSRGNVSRVEGALDRGRAPGGCGGESGSGDLIPRP